MIEPASCPSPLPWETLVAYWARDLPADEEDATELHLMGCAVCTAESRRVAAVTERVRPPALQVVEGGRREATPPPPPSRRRWLYGLVAGAVALAAAIALFVRLPRDGGLVSYPLSAPSRDDVAALLSPPPSAREVRLVPELTAGLTANAARVRRQGGAWLGVRVETGPPFAVVVPRADLTPGGYEVELVWVSPGGGEQSRGFYRFVVPPPSR